MGNRGICYLSFGAQKCCLSLYLNVYKRRIVRFAREKNKILFFNDLKRGNYTFLQGIIIGFLYYFMPVVIRADNWKGVCPLSDNFTILSCNC